MEEDGGGQAQEAGSRLAGNHKVLKLREIYT